MGRRGKTMTEVERLQAENDMLRRQLAEARREGRKAGMREAIEFGLTAAREAELRAEVARLKSDRLYIIGFNDGWGARISLAGATPGNGY